MKVEFDLKQIANLLNSERPVKAYNKALELPEEASRQLAMEMVFIHCFFNQSEINDSLAETAYLKAEERCDAHLYSLLNKMKGQEHELCVERINELGIKLKGFKSVSRIAA